LWLDFTAELGDPHWVSRGVANVRHFSSEDPLVDPGDGITIRGRNLAELASIGFGTAVLDRLCENWFGFGASSFVLVVEHAAPKDVKDVGSVLRVDSGSLWAKAIRAVGALRLAAAGDLSIGPMWVVRAARFNVGTPQGASLGVAIPAAPAGSQFVWTENAGRVYRSVYGELVRLEEIGYGKSPGNLDLALRSFMATYDRWPPGPDSQLLDTITAFEALLGSETEITFKLAFRVASLLAVNDEERGTLLKLMKGFYDTRSKLVHGGHLKKRHRDHLAQVHELRSLARLLLRSFVAFATNPTSGYGKALFEENLDATLVDATEREKLRAALGLNRN